jgi:hypothetical protein
MLGRNAFIIPCVYFFYPETSYRSLEEMDSIFLKCKSGLKGWFDIVRVAREEPKRFGKNGELLINYNETQEHMYRTHSHQNKKIKAQNVEDINMLQNSTETSMDEKSGSVV